MKFPVNYFGSITAWVKANYTHWGENWFLQVGDSMQGDEHRFYIAQDAPLNTVLAKTHVDSYADIDIYFDGNEFYYYEGTTRAKISAAGQDELGHYVQFVSARVCAEVYVKGALLRKPTYYARKGGYYVKPISVGDKLGLVYWDGWIPEEGKSYYWLMMTSNPDWQFVYLSNASYWPKGLGVVKNGGVPSKVLLKDKGTVSLSGYSFTVASSDISVMQNHIWHVI
jgi:hypothetical protein